MKNRVRLLREAAGMSQEEMGYLVGLSRQAVNAIETGKHEPSIWAAYDIAKIFGRSIEEIFLFEESLRKSRADMTRGAFCGGKENL